MGTLNFMVGLVVLYVLGIVVAFILEYRLYLSLRKLNIVHKGDRYWKDFYGDLFWSWIYVCIWISLALERNSYRRRTHEDIIRESQTVKEEIEEKKE